MKLNAFLAVLDELAPLRYAESWDNVGLLVGDPAAEIKRVLVTVDYNEAVAEEARGCDLVIAYHPPMFAAVKRAPHDALWTDAIRRGIALYSMHTALDVARDGTNDFLADACGMNAVREAIRPTRDEAAPIGLGRIGAIPPATVGSVVDRLKKALGLSHLMLAGKRDAVVERVAVAAGAGGELLGDARRARVGLFVTGELRHHDALAANAAGTAVVMTLHSNSERAAVKAYAKRLAARVPELAVTSSEADADPFVIL